jgi:alanine dehydrogenase
VIVGVPKEVKDNEFRVALTPEGAGELTHAGHEVLIQDHAGDGSNIPQERYVRAGAEIVPTAQDVSGAAPNTSTYALTNVTLPYALAIAERGLAEALRQDPALAQGLNIYSGVVTNEPVAQAHDLEWTPVGSAIPGAGP